MLEFLEDARLRIGRDADAGIAQLKADFIGPDAGLDHQSNAAGRGELDGVAGEIEQHLPQPCRVADHFQRQAFVDIGGDLDLAGLRPRRQQFGDALDQVRECERAMFEVDLAGLDLGIIQQFLNQREQRIAGGLHRPDVSDLLRRKRRIHQQAAHADDPVQGGADFVARHGQEARLGTAGGIGLIACFGQRAFALGAVGDVAADALQFRRPAGIVTDQRFAPGDPSWADGACDFLVMDPRAVEFQHAVTLFEDIERGAAADQGLARRLRQFAIGVVDEGDAAVGIAQDDQIALRFEQPAGALLGLLQFPVPIRHGFIMQGDLVHLLAQEAKPGALGGKRDTGDREQEGDADRKRVWVIAGGFRAAAGDKAICAAKRGGEDNERADSETDPGVTAAEAAEVQLEPENPPHRQLPCDCLLVWRRLDAPVAQGRRCVVDLAKCLRPAAIIGCDKIRVDEVLTAKCRDSKRCGGDALLDATRANDEGRGIARRKAL